MSDEHKYWSSESTDDAFKQAADAMAKIGVAFIEQKNNFIKRILSEILAREPEPEDARKVTLAYFESEKEFAVDRFHVVYNNYDYGIAEIVYPNLEFKGSLLFKFHMGRKQWPPDPEHIEYSYCDLKTRKEYDKAPPYRLGQCACGFYGLANPAEAKCPSCQMTCGLKFF